MEPAEILIGRSKQSDHIAIRVDGRMHPSHVDYWDGNWLISPIFVRVGGFTAKIGAGLRSDELQSFHKQLERVYAAVEGRAVLSSLENWIELVVECHGNGSLTIKATVADDPSMWNTLSFEIEGLDQSDIPAIVAALTEVEERFPVFGSADA
ncbi:hypothetical protein ACIBH1_31810 [Nonomuraea sp. NPDC050663]|uniref:WapI family immunity protein n=1 Tax=Nonomuraea sp. NPDC050663 TaxID=3364370 RepID=UPI0037905CC9